MKYRTLRDFEMVLDRYVEFDGSSFSLSLSEMKENSRFNLIPFVEIPADDVIKQVEDFGRGPIISFSVDIKIENRPSGIYKGYETRLFDALSVLDISRLVMRKADGEGLEYSNTTSIHLLYDIGFLFGFFSDLSLLVASAGPSELRSRLGLGRLMDYSVHNASVIDVQPPILDLMSIFGD